MLAGQHPEHAGFKGDLASLNGEKGTALAKNGKDDEAEKALNQTLSFARAVLARDPEDAAQVLITVVDNERLAALAHKRGKQADEERLYGGRPSRSAWNWAPASKPRIYRHKQPLGASAGAFGPSGRGHQKSRGPNQEQRGSTGDRDYAGAVLCILRVRRHQ